MTALETLRLTVPEPALAAFEAALATVCPTVATFRETEDGPWMLEAVRPRGAGEAALTAALALAELTTGVAPALQREDTPDMDWLAATLQTFPEQLVGRITIRGTHLARERRAGRITLLLDAGAAFGSGEHGSTRACLRALQAPQPRPRRVLDLGCGTGILAFAAWSLFRARVTAADVDPWAVRVARRNARLNGLKPFVRLGRANGWHAAWLRQRGPFDLVLANILARPLRLMAPALARSLTPGGQAILSGLLVRQIPWVLAPHRAQGLVLQRVVRDGDWAALVLRRPSQ